MTPDDLHSYLAQFRDGNWSQLTVTDGPDSLHISGAAAHTPWTATVAADPSADPQGASDAAPPVVVTSPSVGLLLLSRQATTAPAPGEHVTAGSWLADLIVADRTDPVLSPVDGTLAERLAGDGDAVEYHQPLLVIKP